MKIGITGATGFIGSNLLKELSKSKENEITVLTRKEPAKATQKLKEIIKSSKVGISVKKVELSNRKSIKKEFQKNNFDLIYHVAGLRGLSSRTLTEYIEANAKSTKIISDLCLKYNVNLVYISSVGVHGTTPLELPCTENSPLVADSTYHYSKILAEEHILNKLKEGLKAIIIRPTITYGPGDYGFIYKIIKLVDINFAPFPKNTRIHVLSVNSLASFLASLKDYNFAEIIQKSNSNPTVIIADKNPISLDELINLISKSLNKPSKGYRIPLNKHLLQAASKILKYLRLKTLPLKIDLISKDWYYSIEKAQTILKYKPKETKKEIIKIIEWYKSQKITRG